MQRVLASLVIAGLLALGTAGAALGAHSHHLTTPGGCVTLAGGGDPGSAYWEANGTVTAAWWAEGHGALHNHVHKNADGSLAAAALHNPNDLMVNACE